MSSTPVKLWNSVGFASASIFNRKTPRGYVRDLLDRGVEEFLERHHELEERYPFLGLMPWCPGGRDLDMTAWLHGLTGIRADQLQRGREAGFGWITTDLFRLRRGREARTRLYLGAHPADKTLEQLSITTWLRAGHSVVLDALSSQRTSLSVLRSSAFDAHRAGLGVLTESNSSLRLTRGMPVLASANDWDFAEVRDDIRTRMDEAPAGSGWWWRNEKKDGPWSLDSVSRAMSLGLAPHVNLDQLKESQVDKLFEIVEAA